MKLTLTAYLGENDENGKRRIVTTIMKDDFLEVTFAMHAEDAESWASQLMQYAQEARGKRIILPS